ncbi:type II toxin-antitoxin system VapC family toxin [Streptomyces sp. P1-3]|uniref:type II toxin-antitoxin system VapC family toxin n=1 Tax=Streptomyces sp. P1-3 TaxID=3421658 RepID=UPI003D3631C1
MIVVDAGPLVALVNHRDDAHQTCREWYQSVDPRSLVVPAPVLAEAFYLIEKYLGPTVEADFIDDLAQGSYGRVVGLATADLQRMSVLVRQYSDFPLGGSDASVIAVAEHYGWTQICTIDRRHFSVVTPQHAAAFDLVPAQL